MPPDALPPTLILDLDDTILDDSLASEESWVEAATLHAPEVAPVSAQELHAAIQRARRWYWDDEARARAGALDLMTARREIVTEALIHLKRRDAPALAQRVTASYAAARDARMRPLPGALETVAWLRERGTRLGLITNGAAEPQRRKVERFALAPLFDVVVIEGEFGCGKPDPRVYLHALAALHAAPDSTWMVGDSLRNDVLAPQRLGISGVWVNATGRATPPDAPAQPDRVIRALSELPTLA
ncbi:MAG TPA: HAD family hydrolase [Ktedonobacterales bacterium]